MKLLVYLLIAELLFLAGVKTSIMIGKPIPSKKVVNATTTPTVINLSSEKLMSIVNDWRYSQGLQPYTRDNRLCVIAKDRVLNDPKLDAHEGLFRKYANYPYQLAENLGGAINEDLVLESWLNSRGHSEALHKPYEYSCIYCKGDYCSQIFSNF